MTLPDVVLLDSGLLGLVSHPNADRVTAEVVWWLDALLSSGVSVPVPEISDYEVRRGLLRAGRQRGARGRKSGRKPAMDDGKIARASKLMRDRETPISGVWEAVGVSRATLTVTRRPMTGRGGAYKEAAPEDEPIRAFAATFALTADSPSVFPLMPFGRNPLAISLAHGSLAHCGFRREPAVSASRRASRRRSPSRTRSARDGHTAFSVTSARRGLMPQTWWRRARASRPT